MDQKNEIMHIWIETGGLVTKKLASKISGLAEPQITRRVQSGELKEYHITGIKSGFIAYRDAIKIKRKRKAKSKE